MSKLVVIQRGTVDCEEAALATASGKTYEEARKAVGRASWFHDALENPIWGNPIAVQESIERLGFKPINRTCTDILAGVAKEGKTLVLFHNPEAPTLSQHWAVLAARSPDSIQFYWGNGKIKSFTQEKFVNLFTGGFPNAAFEVGEPIVRPGAVQRFLNWVKNLFRKR